MTAPGRYRLLAIAAAVLVAGGCALRQPPERSELQKDALAHMELPQQWRISGAAGPVAANWIASFGDARLEALVQEALVHNTDLRVAAARVEQAQGYVKAAGGTLYPTVSALARGGGKMSGDGSGLQGGGLFVSWELDLWGRVRYERAAAEQQYASVAADVEYARQSVAALVAKGWFLAAEARLQLDQARSMRKSAGKLRDLAEIRQQVGIGSEQDAVLARASYRGYQDGEQQLQLAYIQSVRALEVLVGRYPAAYLEVPNALASVPPAPAAGVPSELLERRPDVIAAERRVAAAFNRTQEAKAARLPKISLSGNLTSVSSELFLLKPRDNPVASIGGVVSLPLFTGGALEAQVEIRTAEQQQAVADYARVAQRAFSETESALAAQASLATRVPILEAAVADNRRALELAEFEFRTGRGDLRAVSQQQLRLDQAQAALLRVRGEQLAQRVNLHLALGGGFGSATEVPPDRSASR